MGTSSSIIAQEIAKPADGSDVADSTEAATAEVVRLRALLRGYAGKPNASQTDTKTMQGSAEEEEKNSRVEVWHYNGTAKNARGQKFGDYNFRRVLFEYGADGEKGTVTMDTEYIPASEGSVGGYRSRYVMTWDVESGRIGNPGESWQGTLRKGKPGQPMDFLNKWKNILLFLPVKKLPMSALLDEDNPGEPVPPLTDVERASCESVTVPSGDCWTQVMWFIEKPIVPRKEEVALGEKKYATARAAAHQWLLAALDVDEPVEEVVLIVKRLLSVRRFTVFLTPDQFTAIIKLTRRELARIGATLAKYYNAEGLQAKMGQLGKEAWETALPVRPRQHHYLPTPRHHCFYPQNSTTYETVSMSEYNYIFMLILIGRGINAEFQTRAGGAVMRAVPGCMYSDAPTKSFHRMYNKLWYDHKDSGAPRPSRNIDVVRSYASLSTPSDCAKAYNAIRDEFGGKVQLCKNGFTAADASETAHYRAVYLIVEFVPANKETFGQMAARCHDEWIKFMESRDPLEQGSVRRAMAHLAKGGELANEPVRMLCEVQLMLDTYRATRSAMHLLYKAARADTAHALWRDFSGRVMPKPEET